jgi:hypothetical protein
MSPQQKQVVTHLHQWSTILFLPVITFLVADIYRDFKLTRDKVIQQSERIEYHEDRLTRVERYVFNQ